MIDLNEANRRFYEWLWPHRDTVVRTARLLLRDSFAADDLAQETMLKAFRALHRFQEGTDARAWLLTILRNARIDHIRSVSSQKDDVRLCDVSESVAEDSNGDGEIDPSDANELLERLGDQEIIDALRELPEDIRWTLLLVDVEGLDQSDAATVMNVPLGTVKSRAHRGRTMLKSILEPRARQAGLI